MNDAEKVTAFPVPQATLRRLERGGGGGGGDGLEVRLATVEAHLDRARQDLAAIAADTRAINERLARLEVRVDHLPTTGKIAAIVLGSLSIFSAVITFADQIRAAISASGH